MFLAKGTTLVLLVIFLSKSLTSLYTHVKSMGEEHLGVTKLNDKYHQMSLSIKAETLAKKAFKKELKTQRKQQQANSNTKHKRIYVLEFKGDVMASEVASLRECITAILMVAKSSDEVFLMLESTGGTVHGYGLAASQLQRIRAKKIQLTIAVDKVAASGGYMMASVADHIIAAPFAIIGSIGVVSQIPNFNRLLKNHDIEYEQITAGDYKRTLTFFGENTEAGRRKAQQEIDDTHRLFKDFVAENRPKLDIEKIATGEHWYGKQAMQLNLVDELRTSDDFLYASAQHADLYFVQYTRRKPLIERLFSSTTSLLSRV